MLYWLMSHEALQLRVVRAIREARTPLAPRPPRAAAQGEGGLPAPLKIEGRTATITVTGVLTPTPDMMAEYYGEPNTTYSDLQDSLRASLADRNVREIVWSIDSPGGSVDGLFGLLDAIENAREAGAKPMRVEAVNAHSAAYGIAAAVGKPIIATSRMASFGSVGVATSGFIQGGICGTVVDLTNTDAPEKRPDLSKPEGKAVVVSYLDQLAEEFMGSIARGRGVSVDAVRAGYGRGSSMLAGAALNAGLIDEITDPRANVRTDLTDAPTQGTVAGSMATVPPVEPPAPVAPEPQPTPVALAPVVAPVPSLSDEERAELAAFRAEREAKNTAERRELITDLVRLGAETPATAWQNDAPVDRLASEPLASLRSRVEALRVAKPKAAEPRPPVASDTDDLSDAERARLEKITDAKHRERYLANCRERAAARATTRRK